MRTMLALVLLAMIAGPAHAQSPRGAAADEPPILTLKERRLWSLRVNILGSRAPSGPHYRVNQPTLRTQRRGFVPRQSIDVRSATFVVPILERSASHETFLDRGSWRLLFNRQPVNQDRMGNPGGQPDLVNLEQSVTIADSQGTWLVPFILNPEQVEFQISVPVMAFETVYDDNRAALVEWPSDWPEWVRPALEPSPHIPSDDPFVAALLTEWTDGQFHAMRPAVLAKHLAKRIVDTVQPQGSGLAQWPYSDRWRANVTDPCDPVLHNPRIQQRGWGATPFALRLVDRRVTAYLRGFAVDERRLFRREDCFIPRIREPVESGRANPAVTANLYAALLRAAGIPARVVIGVELTQEEFRRLPDSDLQRFPANTVFINEVGFYNDAPRVRFWNEFFLFDEVANRGEWIPVDLYRQRVESSRAPEIDRPWRFFGNHDELDEIIPVSSVYTPVGAEPTDWVPALWGWVTDPAPVPFFLDGIVRIEVVGLSRRANDGFDQIGPDR